jgi:hypothetical protein
VRSRNGHQLKRFRRRNLAVPKTQSAPRREPSTTVRRNSAGEDVRRSKRGADGVGPRVGMFAVRGRSTRRPLADPNPGLADAGHEPRA